MNISTYKLLKNIKRQFFLYLEQENLQLRTECALLRSETEKLRSMLYSTNNNNNNIQNNNC